MAKKLPLKKNPLINPPSYPFDAPPLGEMKLEHVEQAVDWGIKKTRANVRRIVNNKYNPTFRNTIHALAFADEPVDQATAVFSQYTMVNGSEEVKEVQDAINPKLVGLGTEISMNEKLFERVKHVHDNVDRSKLTTEEEILLDKTYRGFVGGGALLEGVARKEFAEISKKLSRLGSDFSYNTTESAKQLCVVVLAADVDRLEGIPADTVNFYKAKGAELAKTEDGIKEGDFVIPMVPPPISVLESANDRELRREVSETYGKIGTFGEFDNSGIIHEIVSLRHRQAQLLGYENHADRVIREDTRMAGDYKTVQKFLANNVSVYKPVTREFVGALQEFAKERDGVDDFNRAIDMFYYKNQYKKEKVGFNEEEARQYFELGNVLKGMFEHAEKLYGIKMREVEGKYSTLHDDVKTYEVLDGETGEVRALFNLDIYAKSGKNPGAWASRSRGAGLTDGEQKIPVVFNYCNYPKPAEGDPTLLTVSEVETLFHEFGHACHHIMGKGTYPGLTGTAVFKDYVELPSQINELWAFKPEVLATYATNKDGEVIPDHLVEKLQTLGEIEVKWQGLRQTEIAMLDMAFHTVADPENIGDLKEFEKATWRDSSVLPSSEGPPMSLTFGHIFGGPYSAGYYSYAWSDMLVANIFEPFEEIGLYDRMLCDAFCDKMIVPGGTRSPIDMCKDFMEIAGQGRREIDADAMFRMQGIYPKKAAPAP